MLTTDKGARRSQLSSPTQRMPPSLPPSFPPSLPSLQVRVQLAVPVDAEEIDTEAVKKVFPYGQLLPIEIQRGGMRASSGIALPAMGDKNDDWIIAVAAVTVGWSGREGGREGERVGEEARRRQ